MDGLFHGSKPYEQMDDLGDKKTQFLGLTPTQKHYQPGTFRPTFSLSLRTRTFSYEILRNFHFTDAADIHEFLRGSYSVDAEATAYIYI